MDYVGTREIDVTRRCTVCGMATEVTEWHWDLDDDGHRRVTACASALPHSQANCSRFAALRVEEWPASSSAV